MVLLDVRAVALLDALGGDARPDNLRQPVHVQCRQPELSFDRVAHLFCPRLGAEDPNLQLQAIQADALLGERLGDVERVGRRAAQRLGAHVFQHHHLALAHAT